MDERTFRRHMKEILKELYPDENINDLIDRVRDTLVPYETHRTILERRKKYKDKISLSEEDTILMTYADTIFEEEEKPLRTLHKFLKSHIKSAMTAVHILPFFTSSSDGGFAVIDYNRVDPELGDWDDVEAIAKEYRVMADLVLNHVSSRSACFKRFLAGDDRYQRYFLSFDEPADVSEVFRPRQHPLLTRFDTAVGAKYVWTTFSKDQIDLNFHNPEVLLEILEVFMHYLSHGIEFIRLDAIAYVWKELGTDCVNLPQTHEIVKLLRIVAEYVAPYAVILTEVNFPYNDNVSYLEARHEANLAYHFALPPLVIDSFHYRDTTILQEETARIRRDLLFMNFLTSHDGIGLLSAKEVLPPFRFKSLLETIEAHGGEISYKAANDASRSPYELNTTAYDAINDPFRPDREKDVKRYLAACAVALCDKGIPGIYIHCLLGSRNNLKGVDETGEKRMINRERLSFEALSRDLSTPDSLKNQVMTSLIDLLEIRKEMPAFHHAVERDVVSSDKRLFIMERKYEKKSTTAVINVSDDTVFLPEYEGKSDRLRNSRFDGNVSPYGIYFLE
ncbi:alpha amylase, catalytic domain protein [delta proteobacterium NaphS2]|nr:alpha amylase, catalytic domain protein [delta proteobacterium NaphS2]